MKKLIKALLKKIWRSTAFVRRPLARKLDSWIERVLDRVLSRHLEAPRASIERIEFALRSQIESAVASSGQLRSEGFDRLSQQVQGSREMSEHAMAETSLLLDCLLREVSRLQLQLEEIQDHLAAGDPAGHGLNLLEDDNGDQESIEAA